MVFRFRVWLPLSAVLVVLLSIALMFAYGVPSVRARLAAYAETRTVTLAAKMAGTLSGTSGADREGQLALAARTAPGEVILVDPRGRVIDRAGDADGFAPSAKVLATAASGGRMAQKSGSIYVAVAPVLAGGKLVGGLVLATTGGQAGVYQLFLRSGLEAAGIATVLGGGLMLLFATLLGHRVERITHGARSIEGGDLSHRIRPGFKDELGELAVMFNAMAARLETSFADLEDRVAERTAELEGERARLEAVLRQMPSGVVIAEAPSGRVLLSNDQVQRIWRHPFRLPNDLGEYEHYETFHPDGRPYRAKERPLVRSLETGEVVEEEEMGFARGDGISGTMRISSAPIRDREGRVVGAVAIFSDITKRRRIQDALRASEERYRALMETATDAVVMIGEDNLIRLVNDAAERIFGYPKAQMVGRPLTMLIPERLRQAHTTGFERYLETGRRSLDWSAFQVNGRRKSGEEVPLEASFGEFGRDGERFFTGFMRDVTERKKAEDRIRQLNDGLEKRVEERMAQLERERATLDAILNNLSEGVLAASSRERVVFCNPAARFMLGADAAHAWSDFDLWGAVERCALDPGASVQAGVQSGRAYLRVKLEHLPDLDDGGGALAVIQDHSEDRRLQMRQQRFLANAAHELKTPITTILGASELLLTEEDDPETKKRFLGHIFDEARRMQRLSEALLRIARTGPDPREPELEEVDLERMVRGVSRQMAPLAESAGIELSVEDAPASGAPRRDGYHVRADGEWLEESLLVMVGNAVKYSHRGGRVVLRLGPGRVTVEDAGEGISEVDLPRVFDRFYQGENSSGGLGMGLAVCKELVEKMGGAVSIESEKGSGTKIAVELLEVSDG